MKEKKYSVLLVEDQQMPKTLFSHYIESSKDFHLEMALILENISITIMDLGLIVEPIRLLHLII